MWTPEMRDTFVSRAVNSEEERGNQNGYWYNVMPKNQVPDEENPKKAAVTKALMNTILENPEYRIFALKIYDILMKKVMSNPFTRFHYNTNFVVQLKGGSSYMYLIGKADETFPYSDMDIVIYINPHLQSDVFNAIKDTLGTVVQQTISQYKRSIDFMFFSNREKMSQDKIDKQSNEQFVSDELIASFKEDYNEALSKISTDDGTFVSPFERNEFRNASSKQSFVIENSIAKKDSVVRIELPHFEMCERIPMRKTPLFCSVNRSIRFNRLADPGKGKLVGAFDLFRIRFNNLYIFKNEEDGKTYRESATADFIDISIAHQDDAELYDFWENGRMVLINDAVSNIWIVIPDIQTMLRDLYKMIHVYDCPEAKKDKRVKRYEALLEISRNKA